MDETKKQPEEITDVPLPELSQTVEVAPTLARSAAAAGELSGDELNSVVGGGTKTQAPAKGPSESIVLDYPKINLEY
jgi:hypothetical protein